MKIDHAKKTIEYDIFHIFSGSGGGALGFQNAGQEYKGFQGHFRTLGGIDCDPLCCADFKKLTGVDATCMDLFDREQYIDFWGHEPEDNWHEVTPEDMLKASRGKHPDVIFLSPPCKGFSGLLPEKTSKSPKYQALNQLVVRSMRLVMEAYKDDLPMAILIENVPRITSRGAQLIKQVETLLGSFGYVFHKGTHDCGEIGGLGQTRKRFLLIARNPKKVPSFIYQPERYSLKSIGEVIGSLPLPGETEKCGAMHRLQRLAWKTWERLALIPAGEDWRALNNLSYEPRSGAFKIIPWDQPSSTVTSTKCPGNSNGVSAVADPRIPKFAANQNKVIPWADPCGTITGGACVSNGGIVVQDPRIKEQRFHGLYKVTGDIHAGAAAIADPRIPDNPCERGIWVIISEDGTWHRPLTTLEMAALQGLPMTFPDGAPLVLAGNNEGVWREHIGNMVPPPSACAMGNSIMLTLMPNSLGDYFWGFSDLEIWVSPERREQAHIMTPA